MAVVIGKGSPGKLFLFSSLKQLIGILRGKNSMNTVKSEKSRQTSLCQLKCRLIFEQLSIMICGCRMRRRTTNKEHCYSGIQLEKRGLFSIGQIIVAEQKRKENVNKGRPLYMYIFEFINCQRSQTEMEFDTLYSQFYAFHSYQNSSERRFV